MAGPAPPIAHVRFVLGEPLVDVVGKDGIFPPATQDVAEGIVGAAELQMLPDHAFLLNPARGPLVEEAALLEALRQGWIAGAALDTHYYYPMPPDHPLWQFPNVIMTPHISGSESGPYYLPRVWDIFLGNLPRYRAGETLLNELTTEQLSSEA